MGKIYIDRKLFVILIVGFVIRVMANNIEYSPDALSFTIWAKYLTQNSISDLYKYLPSGYLPYPPLYYYILLPFGYLMSFWGLGIDSWLALLLVKIPAMFSDLAVAIGVYFITTKWFTRSFGLIASAFYLLNPVTVYNTSVWGQIDAVIIFLGWLCVDAFAQKRLFRGWFWFILGSLIKLQMLALLPLALILTVKRLSVRMFIKYIFILGVLAFIPFLPLLITEDIVSTIVYFVNLPNQYPYTSIFAYNIWAPLGFLVSDKLRLFGLAEVRLVGIMLFWSVSICILYPFINANKISHKKLFFAAFLLWFAFALFPTRIHSRYLIYTFGFIAPFVGRLPKFAASLTFLMIANFLLPNKNIFLSPLVGLLNTSVVTIGMVLFALSLFIIGCKYYSSMQV